MNLKDPYGNLTRNSLFAIVIDHQNKHVKSFSRHPKIKGDSNCGGFNRGRSDMGLYGLADHVRNNFIVELLHVWKHNPFTLLED
jgi:hypothetical protein